MPQDLPKRRPMSGAMRVLWATYLMGLAMGLFLGWLWRLMWN